ncbi:MAG: hypothetical protein NVSMB29_11240 [Candidatus Dormibacteria bacterium]
MVRRGGLTLAGAGVALLAACGGATSSTPSPTASSTPAPTATAAALPAGLTAHGYPTIADSATFTPGTAATLHGGNVTVTVPATALTAPATFQLLRGDTAYWQPLVTSGQKVVSAFAFRVVDSATGAEVTTFQAPVVAAITDPTIVSTSQYVNTTRATPPAVVPNPKPPVISGTTLTHGNIGDGVGWLVTSPAG